MNLVVDLEKPSLRIPPDGISFTALKSVPISLQFVDGFLPSQLGSGATGCVALTVAGSLVAGGITAAAWTLSGSGSASIYQLELNLNTTAIATLFASKPAFISALLTVDWTDGESVMETVPVPVTIFRANLTGEEGTPAALPLLKATDTQAVDPTNTFNWTSPHAVSLMVASMVSGFVTSSGLSSAISSAISALGIPEAPNDGQTYARSADGWVIVNPTAVLSPSITGTASEGNTLTDANTDAWTRNPTSFTWQWQRGSGSSWTNISGATSSTYTLVLADVGHQVRMLKQAINSNGASLPATETSPSDVVTSFVNVTPPSITCPYPNVGHVASDANTDSWSASPASLTRQWQSSPDGAAWTNISGATSSTYTFQSGDLGLYVRLLKTATLADGSTVSVANGMPPMIAAVLPVPPGAWADWPMTEASGTRADASGNGHDLLDNNGVVSVAGKRGLGLAARTDRDAGRFLSNGDSVDLSSGWTIAINFKLEDNTADFTNTGWAYGLGLRQLICAVENAILGAGYFYDGFGNPASIPASLSDGNWHAAVFVFTPSSVKTFFDGVLINEESCSYSNASGDFEVGCNAQDGECSSATYGRMTVWNRTLSDDEVYGLFGVGIAIPPPYSGIPSGAIAYYPLDDDGSGNASLVDATGNGHNLTAPNGPVAAATGILNKGAVFTGAGTNYLQFPNGLLDVGGGAMSISIWAKVTVDNGSINVFVAHGGAGDQRDWQPLQVVLSGNPFLYSLVANDGGGWQGDFIKYLNIEVGKWYHYAVTVDGSNLRQYFMGRLVATYPYTAPADVSGNPFALGHYEANGAFDLNGMIDEVAVYDRVLTADEIALLSSANPTPYGP